MSIAKGTLVRWTDGFSGAKGSGITLSGEEDGHVIVAVNNFAFETPTGKVAAKDGEAHKGYHPLVWFAAADLIDIEAEQEAQKKSNAAAVAAASEQRKQAITDQIAQLEYELEKATTRHDMAASRALSAQLKGLKDANKPAPEKTTPPAKDK